MKESGIVQVDSTDIGASDHFLVWLELGRTTKCIKKGKSVIRRWRLDRFVNDEVKAKYRDALCAEVNGFSESIKHRVENGSNLVNEEWERIVNRVAETEVGIVCGRAARWWDDEIRAKFEHRRQVYVYVIRWRRVVYGLYTSGQFDRTRARSASGLSKLKPRVCNPVDHKQSRRITYLYDDIRDRL